MSPTETCSQIFSGNGIYNPSQWILEQGLRMGDEAQAESVYSKANVCSYLLPRNCSLQMAGHIFHCVFTWLGRNIGSPWCRSHSIKWNRTGIWWHPGEKSHIQISDFAFLKVPHGWRDISFDLAMGLAAYASDSPLIVAIWLFLFITPNLCVNVKGFRTAAEPWNMPCFSYHSSNLFNNVFLCWPP